LRVDLHQHLWPEPFLAALARRTRPPRLRRSVEGWCIQIEGEPEYRVDLDEHDPEARAQALADDGFDLGLVCSSSPLGVEALPLDEAQPLLDAYHDGVCELPDRFAAWGAVAVSDPDPADVDRLLDRGFVGISLPAGALATSAGLEHCGPLLARLEARGAPLFVHPGPAPWRRTSEGNVLDPHWWPAMTDYIFDLHSAWHAFIATGRDRHPALRLVFAALAGGGPLHGERLATRNGSGAGATDRLLFFDTSSYGLKAIDSLIRCVGIEQLVFGSDRPVIRGTRPKLTEAVRAAIEEDNPIRLLRGVAVAA
jgi:predicted TIM-barrel fold metal-dependent hydrolase